MAKLCVMMTNLSSNHEEASKTKEWVNVMKEEMDPLHKKDVAGSVPTPICKNMIGLKCFTR